MSKNESLRELCKNEESYQALLQFLQQNATDSAENFEKLFQLSPDSILIIRQSDSVVMNANHTAVKISGCSLEELIGKVVTDIWDNQENIMRVRRSLARYGRVDNLELLTTNEDGTSRVVMFSATPIRYQGEDCLLTNTRDISTLIQTHERLQAVEARYEAIVEIQAELICRYDPQTTVIFANEAYLNYMGRSQNDVVGKSFLDFLDESQMQFAHHHIERLLSEKQRITHEMRVQQGPMAGRWIQWTDTPILNESAEVMEIQAVGRDISPSKEAEIALQERETQLNLMLDNVSNVILAVFDRNLTYTVLRGQLLQELGYDSESMLGQPIHTKLSPEFAIVMKEHAQAVLNGEFREIEYPSGNRYILLRSYPLKTQEGIVGGVSMISDITARKQAERKEFELAIERERMDILSQFVRNAAHEFYTPLSTIETTLHLVEQSQDEDRRRRAYEKIRSQTQRIANLVDGMTTMMRLSTANTGARSAIDFPMLFDLLIDSLQKALEAKNLRVDCQIAANLPKYQGVLADLRGALKHVLDNAIRHSAENEIISLKVEALEHAILIHVHNRGEIIPESDLGRIFEMFYRRDNARTTPGLGLGLSIARAIIEQQHGGHISAQSSSDGTSIFIRLPIFPD